MQRRALAAYGIGDGGGEAVRPFPFAQWPHRAIAANLIDTPVDLQAVPVRIAEFDGDLAAGAAPALEIDGDAMPPQVIARAHHLVECRNLEGNGGPCGRCQRSISTIPLLPSCRR